MGPAKTQITPVDVRETDLNCARNFRLVHTVSDQDDMKDV